MSFEKITLGVIKHYYWFLVAIAASLVFGVRDVSSVLIVGTLLATIVCLTSIRWRTMDAVVFFYMVYCMVTYFFAEYTYPMRLYYLGVRAEIVPILFYYIARSDFFKSDDFFENMKKPLLFAMLCGVFFYFFQPHFYVSYKAAVIWDNFDSDVRSLTGKLLYEITRMSSFWPHSYFIGYASLFLFMYMSKKIVVDNCYKKMDLFCLGLSFFCLFFAQQRVSIAFCLLFFVALTIYASYKRLPTRNFLFGLWILTAVCGVGIFFVALNYLDAGFIEYVLNRTVNYDGNGSMVGDRLAMFESFIQRLSLFGSGLGRFGHGAVAEGYLAIPDSDYVRVTAQFGFFGIATLLSICGITLVKGFRIFRYCFFEVCTICFALVAMIGAAVWELGTLQPFLYWFCIGHIQSKYDRREELAGEYREYFARIRRESGDDEEDSPESDEDHLEGEKRDDDEEDD